MSATPRNRLNRRTFLTASGAASIVAVTACGPQVVPTPPTQPTMADPSGKLGLPNPTSTPAPNPTAAPTSGQGNVGYIATMPRVWHAGQTESVAVSLTKDGVPARDRVAVRMIKDNRTIADGFATINGRGRIDLKLPAVPEGDYSVQLNGTTFQNVAQIRVANSVLLFLETDKPIYKPGETVHIRLMSIDTQLKPVPTEAVIEVIDAKGIKIFRKTARVDDSGMSSVDLPLSTEPNLGAWTLKATAGTQSAQLAVRVERYVLPKYEVVFTPQRGWTLPNDAVKATVSAEYSFGKPVIGEVSVVAYRYVGTWQEFARITRPIDGKIDIEIPASRYAAGTPVAGGQSNIRCDVTVTEQSTGYKETRSRLITVVASDIVGRLMPEGTVFKPGLAFGFLLTTESPDRQPIDADVDIAVTYQDANLQLLPPQTSRVSTRNGTAMVSLAPAANAVAMNVAARIRNGTIATSSVRAGHSPSSTFIRLEQTTRGPFKIGDSISFKVTASRELVNVYYEVLARGRVVLTEYGKAPTISLTATPDMAPEAKLIAYQLLANGEVAADALPFRVSATLPQTVQLTLSKSEARPGEDIIVQIATEGAARVGLASVDKAVYILAENRLNLQQVFDDLERLYLKPQAYRALVAPGVDGPIPLAPNKQRGPDVAPVANDGPMVRPAFAAPAGVRPEAGMPGFAGPTIEQINAPSMSPYQPLTVPGALELFAEAGLIILSNQKVPGANTIAPTAVPPISARAFGAGDAAQPAAAAAPAPAAAAKATDARESTTASAVANNTAVLAEVERVRQFFPETWVWRELATDATGRASQKLTAPDSITTWMFRAVALSRDKGLGIGEAQLKVFQPFFVHVDLPYAATRHEELPASIAIYNYLPQPQEIRVDLDGADWFDLRDVASKTVTVAPNGVGSVTFKIRPRGLGTRSLKVTARSSSAADAIVKQLIVEPEGVAREEVENIVLAAGSSRTLDLTIPPTAVPESGRALVNLTGNMMGPAINGLEGLLRMSFGCGEQNMILFAPNVFVSRYLKETRQDKPEVMATAERMMLTGYQRQMVYRRNDGSFSAFGNSDQVGSLWLTAFVLKTFAQARDQIYIDESVLSSAREWIVRNQRSNGSYEPVGFVHHSELLGGLSGTTALTAFVAVTIAESGDVSQTAPAIRYLESVLGTTNDAYALALSAYALGIAKSARANDARDRMLALAKTDDSGMWWERAVSPIPLNGDSVIPVAPGVGAKPAVAIGAPGRMIAPPGRPISTAMVETTGYAAMALAQSGNIVDASRAVRWLVSKRNALGGYSSTQDTVVALQALATIAVQTRSDVNASIRLRSGSWTKDLTITPETSEVMQTIDVPIGAQITIESSGSGQILAQAVRRYNMPTAIAPAVSGFNLDVQYNIDRVEVNDRIVITALARYTPPSQPIPLPRPISVNGTPVPAEGTIAPQPTGTGNPRPPIRGVGMVVLDVSVPTGFEPVTETLSTLKARMPNLKRWDLAGRKVIFYIEDMQPNDQVVLIFEARALFPVRAQPASSRVYAYYQPELTGEHLGAPVMIGADGPATA